MYAMPFKVNAKRRPPHPEAAASGDELVGI
jgi:hypothetical protein